MTTTKSVRRGTQGGWDVERALRDSNPSRKKRVVRREKRLEGPLRGVANGVNSTRRPEGGGRKLSLDSTQIKKKPKGEGEGKR